MRGLRAPPRSGVVAAAGFCPPAGPLLGGVPDTPPPAPAPWAAGSAHGAERGSDAASSNELSAGTDSAPPVTEAWSPPLPERSPSSTAAPGCVSAAEPSDRSLVAGTSSSTAEDAAGPAPVAGPTMPPLPAASVAAATGAEVFKFSVNGDTAGMRPVFDKSKSSHAVGSLSTAWTLPPCQVTVRPRDRGQFWGEVKAKVEGLSAGAGPAVSDVQPVPSQVPASDPVGSTGQDKAVEYDFFENKWTQLAGRTVERNRTLGQGDPRRMVNIDMLMETGNYTRAEGQAGYEPLVQEQCQQTGMAALVQTLQLATPQQSFATIVQGVDEPFLCFAGWLMAVVEKQVSDPAARKFMIQSLAQGNCNAVCKRNIEALPGEPSMSDMVGACAKGIMVHLGLIDVDFSGQIHAMVSTPIPPLTIPKGTQIAQLVPFKSSVSRTEDWSRGDGGFCSTGPPQVRWTAVLTKDRPETLCNVSMVGATPSEIHLRGLLDTGADVSILSLAAWPPQWPLSLAKTSIAGLGGTKQCYVSRNPVTITNLEGQMAIIWRHVTEIPQNLWVRDVLAAWGVRLGTDF
ncbi:hypothetical protein DUI87_12889 [Hirundo rustica rustica]|uniref:Peptidase A2 domain-containing protein n=1 Tax=Hirundo rustica rustica TaxID=333673 RepID=A0A3M0KC83_HIRRU|nr:hypothetical protein DUI87_12889 [Hirundo rustica rustica]